MEYANIAANLALIGVILRGKLWSRVPFLSILATLSLFETPLLYWGYSHLGVSEYFKLFYGIALITFALSTASVIHLWSTQLRLISLSMVILMTMDCITWVFIILNNQTARYQMSQLERPVNLLFDVVWIIIIYGYTNNERRHND